VIDHELRKSKERLLRPIAGRVGSIGPTSLTALNLVFSVGAAIIAAYGWRWFAVGAWLVGRLFDGLDGIVARDQLRQSDLGGYLDMMADTIGYAAVPVGVAYGQRGGSGQHNVHIWMWCAALLAAFYVNTMSWTYLSALAEKRLRGTRADGQQTSVHMPAGLIEGAETIVFFTLFLAWPALAMWWFATMAGLVVLTVVQRLVWAGTNLR
jgi:phosphatidylglycerophosphate synthase